MRVNDDEARVPLWLSSPKRHRVTAVLLALLLLLALPACTEDTPDPVALDSLEALPPLRLDQLTEDIPDEYVLHLREVQFTRDGTRNSIGGFGMGDEFDFDSPEHVVYDTWMRIGADNDQRLVLVLERDGEGAALFRVRSTGTSFEQEHVPSGHRATYDIDASPSEDTGPLAVLSDSLPAETERLRAGVEDGSFWTRSSEADDRMLIGEPSQGCGRNNEHLPDTSRVREVWADDYAPTGLAFCVAGRSESEVMLERTEAGIEILPLDRWDEIEAFVSGDGS